MPKHLADSVVQNFANLGLSDTTSHNTWTPNTDVYETAEHLVVKMELAGIQREDLEIKMQ